MADVIDQANERAAADLASQIAEATRPKPRGPEHCEACDEPISDLRRDLGARLCIDCQQREEHRRASGRRF
jgi:RNA polymerase-binding transcription factor DksA